MNKQIIQEQIINETVYEVDLMRSNDIYIMKKSKYTDNYIHKDKMCIKTCDNITPKKSQIIHI